MGAARTCLLIFSLHLIHAISAQDKRVPQGFVAMRGKKLFDLEDMETYKRKPPYHFVGVKGKKNFDLDPEYKRTPMGFVGMRGKKDPAEMYFPDFSNRGGSLVGEIDYSPNDSFEVKNENVFDDLLTQYLMRLQEDSTEIPQSEEQMTNEVFKRAANMHQFYGVRGKKADQKRPFDLNFRGKFIGVRGKKDGKNAQEIKFLLGQNGPWPKRKQMGFFGMRGKKWMDEASLENETPN